MARKTASDVDPKLASVIEGFKNMSEIRLEIALRTLKKTEITETCWLFQGSKSRFGYGRVYVGSRREGNLRQIAAHRVMYESLVGPIPDGLTLDHLCRVRNCVNPSHLEIVTIGENVLRGDSFAAKNKRKEKCDAGHSLSGDNLYVYRGHRLCKRCRVENTRRWRHGKKNAA